MHSRSVYLAALLISGTQFPGGSVPTLGTCPWLVLSCLLTFLLLPYSHHILLLVTSFHPHISWTCRRQKRQKTLFAKVKELTTRPQKHTTFSNEHLETKVIKDQKEQLERSKQKIGELETRVERLCSLLKRRNSPIEGTVIKGRRPRITMSESNLPSCSEERPVGVGVKWTAASSSNGDLRQVPSDLSHFRRRIDDSICEQRRTRKIVEDAQDKLRNLRQHQAQVEASWASSNPSTPRYSTFCSDHHCSGGGRTRLRHCLHRSMSSLEEELTSSKVFGTGDDRGAFLGLDAQNRPSSSGGRLKGNASGTGGYDKNVSFVQPTDFDVTISWPFQPQSNSTPLRNGGMASQSELYASHSYRLMLLEDMLASCKLQLETSLRANATANSEIHVVRDKMQKLQNENKMSLDRAAHFESKYKNLVHLVQPRLYDLRNQTRSLQQRLNDVNLDVSKDMENYKETFVLNVQTLRSLLQRANCGSLRSKVNDLSAELSIQERQRREAESNVYQHKRQVLQLSNKVEQLTEALQSKETTISILEQDFHEEKEKTQKLEEHNDELFREKSNFQEEHEDSTKKLHTLRQKLDDAREARDKFESETRRLTLELSNLRSTSEARIEQMSAELNDAASALESEREAWFRRQDGARADFKQQTDTLQEKLETTMEELERERNTSFDYKERVEELQIQIRKSEEHVSELKRRVYTENASRIQDLERQLSNAQHIALQSTGDWKKYEQKVNDLEAELHEYKLQFERERRDKAQAQHDFDTAKNELERSEQILKETSTEKQQLLKSVNTFEQENRDLKKVCKQLHTQIDIYQKDTDSKYAKVLEQKRTREQDEIKRLKMEMNQMEKTHSQREQNLLQRLSETKVNFDKLKEQFDRRLNQERDQLASTSTTFGSSSHALPTHSGPLVQPVVAATTSTSTSFHHPAASSTIQSSTVVRRITHQSYSSSKLGRQV